MLADHGFDVKRRTARFRAQRLITAYYGQYLRRLARWDWFMNPITFRDSALVTPEAALGD